MLWALLSSQEFSRCLYSNQKGLDLLILSFKKVIKTKKLRLIIAGNGEEKQIEKLKKLIKSGGLENLVEIPGRVTGEKKSKLLSESICMVVPSRFETFSLTSLEALSSNLPLIHFGIEGLSWIPEGASVRVKPFDTSKLAQAIIEIASNKKVSNSLISTGKKFSSKFSWQKNETQYEKIIFELV